jgi:hypothetical protein
MSTQSTGAGNELELGVLLARIAAQLEELSKASERLQDVTLEIAAGRGAHHAMALQELDRLHQTLQQLGAFVGGVAHMVPEEWRVTTAHAAHINLARLFNALMGVADAGTAACAEFELFEPCEPELSQGSAAAA